VKVEEKERTQIARRSDHALALHSGALVRRGLRDLARDSNWLIKKLFAKRNPCLAVSSAGQVCAALRDPRSGRQRVSLFDIEISAAPFAIELPPSSLHPGVIDPSGNQSCLSWAPGGRQLAVALNDGRPSIHFLDVQARLQLQAIDGLAHPAASFAWSVNGNHLAASFAAAGSSSIYLWNLSPHHAAGDEARAREIGPDHWKDADASAGNDFGDEGRFLGYSRMDFSPDDKYLAAVVEFDGEWADDSLLIVQTQSLERWRLSRAQGHITDVRWIPEGSGLIFCSGGQAYAQHLVDEDPATLPFAAEICRCHPTLGLVAGYCSLLKNSAKGRLFIANLPDGSILDECTAEGVVDICWSDDGTKLYAVTQDGLAYVHERPFA
jgi:WD40 repeat protein